MLKEVPIPLKAAFRKVISVPVQNKEARRAQPLQEIREANAYLSDAIVDYFRSNVPLVEGVLRGSTRDYGDGRILQVSVINGKNPELDALAIMLSPQTDQTDEQRGYYVYERTTNNKIVQLKVFSGPNKDIIFPIPTREPSDLTELQRLQKYNGILKDVARFYEIDVNSV